MCSAFAKFTMIPKSSGLRYRDLRDIHGDAQEIMLKLSLEVETSHLAFVLSYSYVI